MKEGERGWGTEKRIANTEEGITDTDYKAAEDLRSEEHTSELQSQR